MKRRRVIYGAFALMVTVVFIENAFSGSISSSFTSKAALVRSARANATVSSYYYGTDAERVRVLVLASHQPHHRYNSLSWIMRRANASLHACAGDDEDCIDRTDVRMVVLNAETPGFDRFACRCERAGTFCGRAGSFNPDSTAVRLQRALGLTPVMPARENGRQPTLFLVQNGPTIMNRQGTQCTGRVVKRWMDALPVDLVIPTFLVASELRGGWKDGGSSGNILSMFTNGLNARCPQQFREAVRFLKRVPTARMWGALATVDDKTAAAAAAAATEEERHFEAALRHSGRIGAHTGEDLREMLGSRYTFQIKCTGYVDHSVVRSIAVGVPVLIDEATYRDTHAEHIVIHNVTGIVFESVDAMANFASSSAESSVLPQWERELRASTRAVGAVLLRSDSPCKATPIPNPE